MNAADIAKRLAAEAAVVAQYLFPKGKKVGAEWKVASVTGEAGNSLSIRITGEKRGVWADFSTGQGGDLLDAWMAARGVSIAEAMREACAYLGIKRDMPERPARAYRVPDKPPCHVPKGRVREWLNSRGIEDRVIDAFRIGEQVRGGKTYAVFPYLRDGALINVKYRNPDDKRDMRQEAEAEPCLYGWHLIDPKARMVVLTEGEVDCLTLHQVGITALSPNQGAGNHQWIETDWERLERFSEIVVCYDNDEAGEKGAREVIRRLGVERCKRMVLPAKDANEYLQQGADGEDFWLALRNAKPQDPDEMRQLADFMDQVKAMFYPAQGLDRDPVLRLDRALDWFEFRPGELTVWTGRNGHGKSLLLSQVLLGLAQDGARIMVFSGELTPAYQLKRMAKQCAGLDRPSPAYLDAIGAWLRDRVWVFNQVGSAQVDRLLEVFRYANKRYGITHFVIDSLMMTDVPDDGPGYMTAQKDAVRKLCDFAKASNSHVNLVAHPRKAQDEKTAPGKQDVAGSGKLTDGADNVFSVWAALKDEAEADDPTKPDAKLELHKQRNGDVQRLTHQLWFVRSCGQFCSNSMRHPVRYVEFSDVTTDPLPRTRADA